MDKKTDSRRELKVGALVLVALVLFGVGIFLIGDRTHLWTLKNTYSVRFINVTGLHTGNPVHLGGIDVGTVRRIILPEEVAERDLTVWITVDRRYAERIREDSKVHLRSLGLLGDKYVDITSGTPEVPVIPPGGEIPSAPATDVDELIASGEDVMRNLVAISHSLVGILSRLESGEGLLGQLTLDTETSRKLTASVVGSVESLETLLSDLEAGTGTVGRLLRDDELATRLASSVGRLDELLTRVEEAEGLLPVLLFDPGVRARFESTLGELEGAAGHVKGFAASIEEGDGLLPRLISDEEYGRQVTEELQRLVQNLSLVAQKLHEGDGTAAMLLNDPHLYDALNDIVVGVEESRLLRWLIRNRQRSGIRKRFHDEVEAAQTEAAKTEVAPPEEPTTEDEATREDESSPGDS